MALQTHTLNVMTNYEQNRATNTKNVEKNKNFELHKKHAQHKSEIQNGIHYGCPPKAIESIPVAW